MPHGWLAGVGYSNEKPHAEFMPLSLLQITAVMARVNLTTNALPAHATPDTFRGVNKEVL